MIQTKDIRIRDPFVVPIKEECMYYLYGTTDDIGEAEQATGFDAFKSSNLQDWEGPIAVFRPEPGFWSDRDYWAPEVHCYQNRYYMFATFKSNGACRGTQILVANKPDGPFCVHSSEPLTPRDWECLDGTLFVDDDGTPWMVFCHEWLQVHDGEICAVQLNSDLTEALGKPVILFLASEAPWGKDYPNTGDFVTDGPFLFRSSTGELLMIWSSFGQQGYAIGIARSSTGIISGPLYEYPEVSVFSQR